jgi:hypothetical protein
MRQPPHHRQRNPFLGTPLPVSSHQRRASASCRFGPSLMSCAASHSPAARFSANRRSQTAPILCYAPLATDQAPHPTPSISKNDTHFMLCPILLDRRVGHNISRVESAEHNINWLFSELLAARRGHKRLGGAHGGRPKELMPEDEARIEAICGTGWVRGARAHSRTQQETCVRVRND